MPSASPAWWCWTTASSPPGPTDVDHPLLSPWTPCLFDGWTWLEALNAAEHSGYCCGPSRKPANSNHRLIPRLQLSRMIHQAFTVQLAPMNGTNRSQTQRTAENPLLVDFNGIDGDDMSSSDIRDPAPGPDRINRNTADAAASLGHRHSFVGHPCSHRAFATCIPAGAKGANSHTAAAFQRRCRMNHFGDCRNSRAMTTVVCPYPELNALASDQMACPTTSPWCT